PDPPACRTAATGRLGERPLPEGRPSLGCEPLAARALRPASAGAVYAAKVPPRVPVWPTRREERPRVAARAARRWYCGTGGGVVSVRSRTTPARSPVPALARAWRPRSA